ncbi:MAG TPA: glycine zipper 2TM domain-containing protein [Longimicrobiales bacterium]|nr:glycine zipper 2TM domain-containing protein [Longimicrobiales bacterium]
MAKRNHWAAWLLVLPMAMVPAACGGDGADERSALRDDELERELDMAFQGDTVAGVFQDTVAGVEPEPEPGPAPAPPRVQQPRRPERPPAPVPTPQPEPRRELPTPAPMPQPRVVTHTVPMGTSMSLTLNETLSTERNSVGDSFTATLSNDVRDASGNIIVPAGATIRGRLTQVNKSGRVGETGVISLAFETVSFGGRSYPLDATVVNANPQRSNRTSTQEQVAKVAAGAAAGAVLGRVLGRDTRSTVKGAVIGAAAGTAIAMGTADVDVVLPAGSAMTIRVDSPIEVRRTT